MIPSKRCGCTSRLIVKFYPNMEQVLGLYEATHSHPIGQDNARFTRLPEETRVRIAEMLRMGVTHEHIVRNVFWLKHSYVNFHKLFTIQGNQYRDDHSAGKKAASQNDFITS